MPYTLYVDGGGTPKVQTYFSYYCLEREEVKKYRFLVSSLLSAHLPAGCGIYDGKGDETNNIAEYAAVYYGLMSFKMKVGQEPVTVYHDSQLVVRQVKGVYRCNQAHLQPWRNAVRHIWWPEIDYQWVRRQVIMEVLGH